MVAILEVTDAERPALMFELERLIPVLSRDTKEDQETARRLVYVLNGLQQAPPGTGEVELTINDVFALGTRNFAVSVDLEEYWLDLRELANGRYAAETPDPEVTVPAGRYFPEMVADPNAWNFLSVEGAFTDLGFKYDRLLTQESPRARALYNKSRNPINARAFDRRQRNAELRNPNSELARKAPDLLQLAPGGGHGHDEEAPRPRPVGTAVAALRTAPAGLSVVSRATFPGQYDWGVEVDTGVMADELEPNRPKRVNVGGAEIMVVNTEGKVCAAARTCPHRGWDLSRSTVEGGVITCGLHGAQFDVCSGEVLRQPYDPEFNRTHPLLGGMNAAFDPKHTTDPLETYPTRVAGDGEVFVHI